uniref:Uncharacterized protein n=1 Tax=Anguilla anguilla TaxID=7936 RepID=A0A0E9U6A8_ANGAN
MWAEPGSLLAEEGSLPRVRGVQVFPSVVPKSP